MLVHSTGADNSVCLYVYLQRVCESCVNSLHSLLLSRSVANGYNRSAGMSYVVAYNYTLSTYFLCGLPITHLFCYAPFFVVVSSVYLAEYVSSQLKSAGFTVRTQEFRVATYEDLIPDESTLNVTFGSLDFSTQFVQSVEFSVMRYSGSGEWAALQMDIVNGVCYERVCV